MKTTTVLPSSEILLKVSWVCLNAKKLCSLVSVLIKLTRVYCLYEKQKAHVRGSQHSYVIMSGVITTRMSLNKQL